MAILTAGELKARETPEFPVDLGGGDQVVVRRPDLQMLVLKGLIPTPLLGEMIKLAAEWAGQDLTHITEEVIKSNDKMLLFVNTFVCAAMVSPRVFMTAEARTAAGEDGLLVDDLTLSTRKTIVVESTRIRQAAVKEVVAAASIFPEGQPSEGSGPDVSTVRAEAV